MGKNPLINLDQRFMLFLVVFHKDHIGAPHGAVHHFQIVVGSAFQKPSAGIIVIGTNNVKVVLSNKVSTQAVTRSPFDLRILWKGFNDEIEDLPDLVIRLSDVTKIR